MDLLLYVSSYYNCAVNHVPREVVNQWRKDYPQLKINPPLRERSLCHVRFLEGRYISYFDEPYHVGDSFMVGEVERVIEYEDLCSLIEDEGAFDLTELF